MDSYSRWVATLLMVSQTLASTITSFGGRGKVCRVYNCSLLISILQATNKVSRVDFSVVEHGTTALCQLDFTTDLKRISSAKVRFDERYCFYGGIFFLDIMQSAVRPQR